MLKGRGGGGGGGIIITVTHVSPVYPVTSNSIPIPERSQQSCPEQSTSLDRNDRDFHGASVEPGRESGHLPGYLLLEVHVSTRDKLWQVM